MTRAFNPGAGSVRIVAFGPSRGHKGRHRQMRASRRDWCYSLSMSVAVTHSLTTSISWWERLRTSAAKICLWQLEGTGCLVCANAGGSAQSRATTATLGCTLNGFVQIQDEQVAPDNEFKLVTGGVAQLDMKCSQQPVEDFEWDNDTLSRGT